MDLQTTRQQLNRVVNRMRCIASDCLADPEQKRKAYESYTAVLLDRLAKLRDRYHTAQEQISVHAQSIRRIDARLLMLRNAVQVDKLRDLLLKIRSLEKPKSKPKKLRRTAGTAKHRIKELEYIRRGLEVDVLQLTRLISNGIAEEEQKLVALLELEQARYDDYLANCGDRGYDEWQRLDAERKKLQHDERCLMRQSSIEKYKEMHGALEALKATFSPEALAIILGVKK